MGRTWNLFLKCKVGSTQLIKVYRLLNQQVCATIPPNKSKKRRDDMSNFNKLGVLVLFVCIFVLMFLGLSMGFQAEEAKTEVGDVRTTNQQSPVYESYQPGKLGGIVCTLPNGTDVTIRAILTDYDFPGHESSLVAGVIAFMVETSKCSGWILPEYIN